MSKLTPMAFLFLMLSGCASMERSVLLGSIAGSAAGFGLGAAVEPSSGSVLIGASVGAVMGGTIGYLAHRRHAEGKAKGNRANTVPTEDGKTPSLTPESIDRLWIPPKIEGDKYLEGHWLYIHKPKRWRSDNGK